MTVFIFGEAMLEYHGRGGTGLRYGGDTLNTAIHMARKGCDVAYVTAVGTDPISDAMVAAWEAEGIDVSHVLRHPYRSPGIYAIHLDEEGERSFLYWRDQSAAREMFDLPRMNATLERAATSDLVYFSLISLAVIGGTGRERLLQLAAARKRAGRDVAYDSNYRPLLWQAPTLARSVSMEAAQCATIGLPTNVDEQELFDTAEREDEIAARWLAAGCNEIIVKAGHKGCLHADRHGTHRHFETRIVDVVDSSGAGDAFNAGFLMARLSGCDLDQAIEEGQALAARTVGHLGAIAELAEQ